MLKRKTFKKILTLLMLISIFLSSFSSVFATDISSANLFEGGQCSYHLQFNKNGTWSYVTCTIVYHTVNGKNYPAFCLNVNKPGIEEVSDYTVSIESILQDDRIWRCITAGYPYKSPEELGLSEFDAFMATKQAVYSILYDRDVRAFYRGADAIGNQILNVIEAQVNEGRYGTRQRIDPSITFNKIGTFKLDNKDSNYYMQEYSISSNVNMDTYTITDVLGFPSGTLVTDLNNNIKNTFSSGSNFKILVPISALGEEISGTIVANGRCKSYPIFYGIAPNPAWQDYAITYDPYSITGGRTKFNAKVVGTVTANKVEYGNEENTLAGAKYNIYEDTNNNKKHDEGEPLVLQTGETNENGIVQAQLGIGNYVAVEVQAPTGYNLSEEEYPFSFTATSLNASFTNRNIVITGGLNLTKTDREDTTKRLEGAKYKIYEDTNNNKKYDEGEPFVTETEETNENGLVSVSNLRYGNYIAVESQAPSFYELDTEPIAFSVENQGQIINIIAKDTSSKGNIKVIKTSEDNRNLEGIQFRITGTSYLGETVDEIITTDENGIANLDNIQIGENYKIEELNVPEGYVKPENQTFNIEANKTTEIHFYNAIIKGKITLEKRSSEYNDLTGFEAGTPLPGTEYTIYDENMNVLQVVTTGEDGTVTTDYIKYGKVYIKETKAPSYYLIDDAVHELFIKNNEEIEFFAHTDESVKIKVNVYKQGIKQTTCNQEIRYDFSNIENNSNVPLENFYWVDNLPKEVRINSLFTGTYNQDLEYTISYKTNKKDWKDLDNKYSTQKNNYIDFTAVPLEDEEFITDYRLNFGTTNPGFKEVEKPFILVRVNDNLSEDTIFTNFTTVGGSYLGKEVTESSKWSTCLYEKELNVKKLPRTGF